MCACVFVCVCVFMFVPTYVFIYYICVCVYTCTPTHITNAMHNIIASERSGVECARDEIYAHCEITITRI